jgi:hypothetical protein
MAVLNSYEPGVIHHLPISTAASGDTTILAGVAGKRLMVLSYVLAAVGAVAVKFKGGSTDLSGAMSLGSNGTVTGSNNPFGHVVTAAGSALILNLSGAVQVSGHVTLVEIREI